MGPETGAPGFVGAKILLVGRGHALTYLRDDRPGLPWAGLWDLPGGGREGDETPEACGLRELHEEFGLTLPESRLVWARAFPAIDHPGRPGWFFAGRLTGDEEAAIRFGDEGQHWRMMPLRDWLEHPRAVAPLQDRSRIALAELGWL